MKNTTSLPSINLWRKLKMRLRKFLFNDLAVQDYIFNILIMIYCIIESIFYLREYDQISNGSNNNTNQIIFIFLSLILNITLLIFVYKKFQQSSQVFIQFLILACVLEYFYLMSLQQECFFIFFNSILLDTFSKNTQKQYYFILAFIFYAEIRYSFMIGGDFKAITRFTFYQIAALLISYLFYFKQEKSNKDRTTSLLKSLIINQRIQGQADEQDGSFNPLQKLSDNQIDEKIQNKMGKGIYMFHNISFSQKKVDNNNKVDSLDFSNQMKFNDSKAFSNQNCSKAQSTLKQKQEIIYPQKLFNTSKNASKVSSCELISIWKCLNVLSTGIILLSSQKELIFKSKTVKQLIRKDQQEMNFIQFLFQLPLTLNDQEENIQSDPLVSHQNEFQQLKDKKEDQFEERAQSILCDSRKRINHQKTLNPKVKGKYDQQGSVIYNLYNSQKQNNSETKLNKKKYRKMATAEVFLKENIKRSSLLKNDKNNIQDKIKALKESELEISTYKMMQAKNKQHSTMSQTDLANQQKYNTNCNISINNGNFLASSNQGLFCNQEGNSQQHILENQNNSSSNIIQNNNQQSNFRFTNYSKSQNEENYFTNNLINYKRVCSQRKNQNVQNQLNINTDELKQTFIKCIIPDKIEKLFQEDDLILEDVVDFLIEHSNAQKQPKFNTECQFNLESDGSEENQQQQQYSTIKQLKNQSLQNDHELQTQEDDLNEMIPKSEEEGENDEQINIKNNNKQQYQKQNSQQKSVKIYQHPRVQSEEDKQNEEILSFVNTFTKDKNTKSDIKNINTLVEDTTIQQGKSLSKSKRSTKTIKKEYQHYINNNCLHIQIKTSNVRSLHAQIELKLSCLLSSENDEKFILIEISDVTRLKKVANEESIREYKNKMLSSISHELRTPLNCSIQLLDMLSQSEDISEVTKQVFINPALYSNQLLLNIINDILDLAQINYGSFKMQFQQLELPKICAECLNLISLQAMQKNLTLELELDPHIPEKVNSDPNRIRQVLLNLLNNSLKFTQTGMVSIKVKLIEKNLIQIDVQDTGCGIPKQNLSKIIGQFGKDNFSNSIHSRSKLNTSGAGLGLTIANNLATGLGGNRKLQVKSIENEGSIFSFCIVNHPLNQIGCTFEEKRIFSKQIINWECFSQYSQYPSNMNRKSEVLSQCIPISSSQLFLNSARKKNNNHNNEDNSSNNGNIRFSDATQTIQQFNNDFMVNSISHQQSNYFNVQNQLTSNYDHSSKNIENNDLKIYSNNIIVQEGSIKKSKYKQFNEDQSIFNELNSPQLFIHHKSPDTRNQNYQNSNQVSQQHLDEDLDEKSNFCSIDQLRRKSVNDSQHNQQQNTIFVQNNRDQIQIKQPIRYTTNSVLVLPNSTSLIDMKNSNPFKNQPQPQSQYNDKQNIIINMQASISDKCYFKNQPSFPSLSETKFLKLQQQISDQNSENNNTYQIQKMQQNLNTTQPSNQNFSNYQMTLSNSLGFLPARQYSIKNSNTTKSNDFEEDSCNINYFQESQNKKMPNEFNFIQLQHKPYNSNNQIFSHSISNSQQNEDGIIKIQNQVQETEEFQSSKNQYHLNLIYDNMSPSNQLRNSIIQNYQNLSQINETINESESFCIPVENTQKNHLFQQNEGELNKRQTNKLLQPNLKDRRRESKEDTLHNLQISPKKQQIQQQYNSPFNSPKNSQSSISIQSKKEEKLIITNQMKIQAYNRQRKCKCPNLLIVDDNEFNLYALDIRLKSYGFVSDKATDGNKAVDFVKKRYEQTQSKCCNLYTIIFMDIDMPVKNGYETTTEILEYFNLKKIVNPTPISACSAYVQDSEIKKAKKIGMKYYITKPINQQSLEKVLESCLFPSPSQN